MTKISVIIPVYNVENFINEAVESVANQSYKNIEIILVDDGSTDKSGEICDELKRRYNNIVVIHQDNMGLSAARNRGLEICTGDYVSFVDADDLVNSKFYESLIHSLGDVNETIALCRVERFSDGNFENIEYEKKTICFDQIDAYDEIADSMLGKKTHFCNVSACQFLFPIQLLKDIKFPVGKVNEDWFFSYRVINRARSIIYCSDAVYYYRTRVSSLSTSEIVRTDMLEGMSLMIDSLTEKGYLVQRNKLANIYIKRSTMAYLDLCRLGYDEEKVNSLVSGIKKYLQFSPCKYVSVYYYLIAAGIIASPDIMKCLFGILRRTR